MQRAHIHVAIPLMDEWENMPALIDDIQAQTYDSFTVWFCVNQPEYWRNLNEKSGLINRNIRTLHYLQQEQFTFTLEVLDYTSMGKGWSQGKQGVGMARKVLMDEISKTAKQDDIILSLDGDTRFDSEYFESIANNFETNPQSKALSVPYYHKLTGNTAEDRAILRYEIYMRHYQWQLQRIRSPYAFTALGSAMACRVDAYRQIGGMTPKKSGEDFYFLQKMVKYKGVRNWNQEWVYPTARFSDRVFFGTGPAMIKGASGDWTSYPIYRFELFDEIEESFHRFPDLYKHDIVLSIDEVFEPHWAAKLRANTKSVEVFVKACHDKFDGLRTLQFLKSRQKNYLQSDEQNLHDFARRYFMNSLSNLLPEDFSFSDSPIDLLNQVRVFFVHEFKKNHQD